MKFQNILEKSSGLSKLNVAALALVCFASAVYGQLQNVQYIRIRQVNKADAGIMNFAAIQAFNTAGVDVARGKATSASSVQASNNAAYGPQWLVAGSTSTPIAQGTSGCTQAGGCYQSTADPGANGTPQWVEVDLGGPVSLSSVVVWNRNDANSNRALNDVITLFSNKRTPLRSFAINYDNRTYTLSWPTMSPNAPSYVGCYEDKTIRAFTTQVATDITSVAQCDNLAFNAGSAFFAIQDARLCFYGGYGFAKYQSRPDTECNLQIGSRKALNYPEAGGSWRNAVYKTRSAAASAPGQVMDLNNRVFVRPIDLYTAQVIRQSQMSSITPNFADSTAPPTEVQIHPVENAVASTFTSIPTTRWYWNNFFIRNPSDFVPGINILDRRMPNVFVLDSGINFAHSAFQKSPYTHVSGVKTVIVSNDFLQYKDYVNEGSATFADLNGHGTAVASLIVGAGLSPAMEYTVRMTVYNTKVLNQLGKGFVRSVVEAIADIVQTVKSFTDPLKQGNVINLALEAGNEAGQVMFDAISRAYTNKVIVVVGAGNKNAAACDDGQSGFKYSLSVGALRQSTVSPAVVALTSFTNKGNCVDMLAPGQDMVVAKKDGGYATMSGTSFAAAMATSAVASFLAIDSGLASWTVEDPLQQIANFVLYGESAVAAGFIEPTTGLDAQTPKNFVRFKSFFAISRGQKRNLMEYRIQYMTVARFFLANKPILYDMASKATSVFSIDVKNFNQNTVPNGNLYPTLISDIQLLRNTLNSRPLNNYAMVITCEGLNNKACATPTIQFTLTMNTTDIRNAANKKYNTNFSWISSAGYEALLNVGTNAIGTYYYPDLGWSNDGFLWYDSDDFANAALAGLYNGGW